MAKSLFATLLIPPPEKALDREPAIGWLTHNAPGYGRSPPTSRDPSLRTSKRTLQRTQK